MVSPCVDIEVDLMKAPIYRNLIASKTAVVIRSEVDVFDKIATKGSTDPVLEPVSASASLP